MNSIEAFEVNLEALKGSAKAFLDYVETLTVYSSYVEFKGMCKSFRQLFDSYRDLIDVN